MHPPVVLLESYSPDRDPDSFAFSGWLGEIVAHHPDEVRPALEQVERAATEGCHAAGYIAYEAAAGLDPVLATHPAYDSSRSGPDSLPLVWFGLFRYRHSVAPGSLAAAGPCTLSDWRPDIPRDAYDAAIGRIREYIAAGDTYQVNFTFRMHSDFHGDDRALYRDLCDSQKGPYCAYLDLGRYRILSASPELFFSLKHGVLTARPMKGTRPRGRYLSEDQRQATALRESPKDRAENVMIVDLLRNDVGRVATTGSVAVPRLWEIERYETVFQMTSTVMATALPETGLVELLRALYPCGSVTGAPKVRTMQIIAEMENSPRGVYTGAIGCVSPGPEYRFNVAIRTVVIDTDQGSAEFGVGGGITWDSSAEGEYEECRVKARLLAGRRPDFRLLETLLHEPGCGYFLLERHLERLQASARYFGYACDPAAVSDRLHDADGLGEEPRRVRLTLSRDGSVELAHTPLAAGAGTVLRAALCPLPVDSTDVMLYHKTTCRTVYDERRAVWPGCDEVILQNERGELTECCIGNLVMQLDGLPCTPPVDAGLLAGTYRDELLARGELVERVLLPADLQRAEAVYLINSVRRRTQLDLVD